MVQDMHAQRNRRRKSSQSHHIECIMGQQQQQRQLTRLQPIPEHQEEIYSPSRTECKIHPSKQLDQSTLPPLFPRNKSLSPILVTEIDDYTPLELVNRERMKHRLTIYRLSRTLNRLASEHASQMAMKGTVYHSASTIDELKVLLRGTDVAENIQRGDTVLSMHVETMRQVNRINRSNVLSTYFTDFGYGIATGQDGKVYCCQLFRR